MKRAIRVKAFTQKHDYNGEFNVAIKKQIYEHMKITDF